MRDMRIEQRVRGLLTKMAVDMRLVDFSVIGGVVYLKGSLRFAGSKASVPSSEILWLQKEIRRIVEVRDLIMQVQAATKEKSE